MELQVPASNVLTNKAILDLLADFKADLEARALVQVGLCKNNFTPDRGLNLGSLSEAGFGGYARVAIDTWDGPFLNALGQGTILDSALALFQADGTGETDTIYGYFIAGDNSGDTATATAVVTSGSVTSVNVDTGGTKYEGLVTVTFSGGGGTGATATATVTDGVITMITVTNGGTGYATAPTVTISAPQTLLETGLFPAPVSMGLATDALPMVPSIALQPVSYS